MYFYFIDYFDITSYYFKPAQIGMNCHSVLEWIWVKGSYLSQWLPQGERAPPKESKSRWIEISHVGSH